MRPRLAAKSCHTLRNCTFYRIAMAMPPYVKPLPRCIAVLTEFVFQTVICCTGSANFVVNISHHVLYKSAQLLNPFQMEAHQQIFFKCVTKPGKCFYYESCSFETPDVEELKQHLQDPSAMSMHQEYETRKIIRGDQPRVGTMCL